MPQNVWDDIYKNYTGPDSINRYIYSRIIAILEKYIQPRSRILEAGCGSGFLVSYFQNKGHESVGLDIHEEPLAVAKIFFGVTNTVQGDIFNLPFKDRSFDVVWNEGVLEHFKIEVSIKAAKEMARVSKKFVIIDVPNRYSPFVVSKFLKKIAGIWPYGYEESYSIGRLRYLMEQAGLEVVAVHGVFLSPPLHSMKSIQSIAALLFLVVPIPERLMAKTLNFIGVLEDRFPWLARHFGFHLILVGRIKNSQ